ncbi:sensor histidine kinase [Flavobacterium sp. C4GT6]|uniref:sensor histidine kinase n=1 Tax=Flavobacterium sp. C4GT6 TaxID=3103818 RepID=UPI002ED47AFB
MIKQFMQTANEAVSHLTEHHLWVKTALWDFYTHIPPFHSTVPVLSFQYPIAKILLIAVIFMTILIISLFSLFKNKLKKHKIMSGYETETKLAKKVHDEIANELYNILCYVSVKDLNNPEYKERLLSDLDFIYNKSRNLSREINNIDTGNGYKKQLKLMLNEYQTPEVNIIIKDIESINWIKVCESKKIAAYRALQELMINMRKHSSASVVVIQFRHKGSRISISYSDNGKGLTNNPNSTKNGLLNVENRMVSINGKVIFEPKPGKGLSLTLSYPS